MGGSLSGRGLRAKALQGRASLYLEMGRMKERLTDAEQLAAFNPRDANYLTGAAEAGIDAAQPAKARKYAEQALAVSPRNMAAIQRGITAA